MTHALLKKSAKTLIGGVLVKGAGQGANRHRPLLSDMDAEIAALEAKLAKARGLEQGMMQELLTGRIRLV